MPRDDEKPDQRPMRLQRYLAAAGIGSRRACEELISTGRVEVDGRTIHEPGCTVVPGVSDVRVDTERVKLKPKKYYLLNKPVGVVCTHNDPGRRPRAIDLIPHPGLHLFTVGRLDENSEGLLIITNDGDLAERLAHPRYQVLRTYRVLVAGEPGGEVYEQLRKGLYFTEGKFRVQHVKRIRKQGRSTLIELQLAEGQNREVRRLLARVGHKVMRLQRVGFGPVRLGAIPVGEFRSLTSKERDELLEFAWASPSRRREQAAIPAKHRAARPKPSRSQRDVRPAAPEQRRNAPSKGKPTSSPAIGGASHPASGKRKDAPQPTRKPRKSTRRKPKP